MTTAMTTPPVQRARLTDAQLRPHRPTVEVLVPAGGGLLAKIGRGVKAALRMRQAKGWRRSSRFTGCVASARSVWETIAAYQEVVDLLAAIAVAPKPLPEDWAYFYLCANDCHVSGSHTARSGGHDQRQQMGGTPAFFWESLPRGAGETAGAPAADAGPVDYAPIILKLMAAVGGSFQDWTSAPLPDLRAADRQSGHCGIHQG